jgi:DNA-directed RNA polymerase sigma subunit (sigma70/sigma32)
MSPERVELLLRGVTVSLDAPTMGDDSSQSLGDTLIAERSDETLAGGDAVEQAWIAALKTATEDLSPLDFFLLVRRDGLDGWPAEKLSQLAAHLGLGREVLRRREAKARADIVQRGQRLPASLI